MRFLAAAASALSVLVAAPAGAQTNPFPGSIAAVNDRVSSNEIIAFLQAAGVSARYLGEDEKGDKTIEGTVGTDMVYFALRNCEGAGAAGRCGLVQPFGFFDAQGVTYDQINNFNLNGSINSFAGLMPDGRGILASRTYLNGGVAFDHVKFGIATFFLDTDRLLDAIKPGLVAQVSFDRGAPDAGVILELAVLPESAVPHVNSAGAAREGLLTDALRAVLAAGGLPAK